MVKGIRKFIGDKAFYKQLLIIVLPIIIQQLMLSIAGYVDSIMVNNYSDAAYAGVSAANKVVFILIFIWMAVSATASIFVTQYFGAGNKDKIKESSRLCLYASVIFAVLGFLFMFVFGKMIINSFISDEVAREYGYGYLDIIKWTAFVTPFVYAFSTLFRSVKRTILPSITGIIEILINVFLNYCLIFGHLGLPQMNARGAALATLISKIVNLAILTVCALCVKSSMFYGMFAKLKVGFVLVKQYIKKGLPLIGNELLWAIANIAFIKFYTYNNDTWFLAYSYALNISDLFFIFFAGLGNGTAIIVGASLGKGDFAAAKRDADRMRGTAVMVGIATGIIMAIASPFLSLIFQPTDEVRSLMVKVLVLTAVFVTLYAYNATCFFILRAGGDSLRAFILDQMPTFIIGLPLAILFGVNAADWGITLPAVFAVAHACDVAKLFVATKFVKQEKWIVNLTVINEDEKVMEQILEKRD
ncbi:MAG: MATE family efflux transporter [Clostridia bacterium]|nr:MATE family efflux transporter [Clostridia bacterium]